MNYSQIYQVIELNLMLKNAITEKFPTNIKIIGEISNYKKYPSGHAYFSLKDEFAQINCVFFKTYLNHNQIEIKNGLLVVVDAKVMVYEKNGNTQLIIHQINLVGEGALQQQFEAIRQKLEKQGLFNQEHKKSLPIFPINIGIIASLQSDALQDILTILKRRYPIANIYLYPSLTQGQNAVKELIWAINLANQHAVCDCLIITRGGGSLEDLWCFNDEKLALNIFHSTIPIISAIGHENNYTISDYVSDLRAPTPSAAAEMITQDISQINKQIKQFKKQITSLALNHIFTKAQQIDNFNEQIFNKLNYLVIMKKKNLINFRNLFHLSLNQLNLKSLKFSVLIQNIKIKNPVTTIEKYKNLLALKNETIFKICRNNLFEKNQYLAKLTNSINSYSALSKGYAAITYQHKIITTIKDLPLNKIINLQFKDGKAKAKVFEKIDL